MYFPLISLCHLFSVYYLGVIGDTRRKRSTLMSPLWQGRDIKVQVVSGSFSK